MASACGPLAPGAIHPDDLRPARPPRPRARSGCRLPERIAPGVLYMVSDLSGEQTGKVLGVSSRGVREIKMMQTKGFSPTAPWTAQDVADHAGEIFFPEEEARVPA